MSLSSANRPPRVALVGVTGYAGIYLGMLRPFHERRELELVAVVIINPRDPAARAAAAEVTAWGATIHESHEALCAAEAGRIDLCLIPTGIAWHARLTVAALRAGMHVLVEKPLAGSLADAALIRAAEKETGRWVAVGFQDIYAREARDLRAELLAGLIGPPRAASVLGLWPRPVAYYTRNPWAGRLRADHADVYDSPLNNAFAHFVNLALFFTAAAGETPPAPRCVDAELFRVNAIETFDTAVVRARSADGVAFWFGFSHATREFHQPEILITGTSGRAHWVHEKHLVIENQAGLRRVVPLPDAFAYRHRMLMSVLARLRDPATWICDTALAARHTAFIRSVHDHAPVRDFPADRVERERDPETESDLLTVAGLGAALRDAFEDGGTLAARGFGPAPECAMPPPSTRVDLAAFSDAAINPAA
jgi:predicted dehydrogenase